MILEVGVDTYASVDECVAYAESRGLSFDGTQETMEAALRRATTWVDGRYAARFNGRKTGGREQALQWPRTDARDAEGWEIDPEEVPPEIVRATCEAAIRELSEPCVLSPDVTPAKAITAASVSGAVSVQYAGGSGIDGQRPVSTAIDDILAGLIGARPLPGTAVIGSQARA